MFLKNNAKRLITVNGKLDSKGQRSVKFQLKPGNNPAVEVPDELCKTEYVKALLASGSVVQVQGDPSKPDLPGGGAETQGDPSKPDLPDTDSASGESLYADFDKAQLTAQCEARDIEITSRDTKADLIAKLEASDE
tara:strand:+ start:140 stop:547 length:408 start_codon:yes stop_codon:yes gene_type:complete